MTATASQPVSYRVFADRAEMTGRPRRTIAAARQLGQNLRQRMIGGVVIEIVGSDGSRELIPA